MKTKSINLKNTNIGSIENLISDMSEVSINQNASDSSPDGNSEIEALLAGDAGKPPDGNSEIEALLAGDAGKPPDGNSEIEALLAGAESNPDKTSQNAADNSDTNFMIMEKLEPMENDLQNIKTDFDQFKQDLTNVKEEVEILSTSFENTMTDIKSITTDLNNPLNFMKEDSIKKNIQTINVDKLIQEPIDSESIKPEPLESVSEIKPEPLESVSGIKPEPLESVSEIKPEPLESVSEIKPEPLESVSGTIEDDAETIPEEISLLIDELSRDFIPEQVFELTKIHCQNSKIELGEKQLMSIINEKTNSDSEKKFSDFEFQLSSKKSQLQILNEEI